MYIDFEKMPKTSRIWVYQADKSLEEAAIKLLGEKLKNFTDSWESHQQNLKASAKFFYRRFIILAVDESLNEASGCSIDKSVHFLQEIEEEFRIKLFDRSQIAFLKNGEIYTETLKNIKVQIALGNIEEDTLIFNNLVQSIEELENKWQIEAKTSWLGRYFREEKNSTI